MCEMKSFCRCLLIALMSVAILIASGVELSQVNAQVATPLVDHGTCIKRHENLYFLYDTGNWFCIRESPMRCVDCHGGNPYSIKQEQAHANRKARHIVNEDISKCQECHPRECGERVAKFNQVAGISEVLIAVAYQPATVIASEESLTVPVHQLDKYPDWISAMELITLVLISGLAVVIYLVHRTRHQ